jgi:hypothetical protein
VHIARHGAQINVGDLPSYLPMAVALHNNLPVYSDQIALGPQHAGAEAAKVEALRCQLRGLGKDDDSSSRLEIFMLLKGTV